MARTPAERVLIRNVWRYYRKEGRRSLPWRKTRDPYRILVSEVMLQQTQVDRVIPKYRLFLRRFPRVQSLSEAPLRDVLILWQGLGYNRRAKYLHEAAKHIVRTFNGVVPKSEDILRTLPGVGSYTASAVCAFAFNNPVAMLETNIRAVLLAELLPHRTHVADSELFEITERLCDKKRSREWYWALMDYGAYLKKTGVRTNQRSKHYTRQQAFSGSLREVRGAIVRVLADGTTRTEQSLARKLPFSVVRTNMALTSLLHEGLVTKSMGRVSLPKS